RPGFDQGAHAASEARRGADAHRGGGTGGDRHAARARGIEPGLHDGRSESVRTVSRDAETARTASRLSRHWRRVDRRAVRDAESAIGESVSHARYGERRQAAACGASAVQCDLGSRFRASESQEDVMVLRALVFLAYAAAVETGWIEKAGGTVTRDSAGHVTAVDLRASWITDSDMSALARMPDLKRLDLSLTRISDRGMRTLR